MRSTASWQPTDGTVCTGGFQGRAPDAQSTWDFPEDMLYNGQKGFHSPGGRRGVQLAMVSYEERKAAVEYCIAHEKNYKLTAVYNSAFAWRLWKCAAPHPLDPFLLFVCLYYFRGSSRITSYKGVQSLDNLWRPLYNIVILYHNRRF